MLPKSGLVGVECDLGKRLGLEGHEDVGLISR